MKLTSPKYVKSISFINSLQIPVEMRLTFKNDEVHYYTCKLLGCKIINSKKQGTFRKVIPIVQIAVLVKQLNFAQIVDTLDVRKVTNEFFQLTAKKNADLKDIESTYNSSGGNSLSFEENLESILNVPQISIKDMNYFDNDNRFLILKRIDTKKKSSNSGRLLGFNNNRV